MADDILQTEQDLIDNLLNNLPTGYAKSDVKVPNGKFNTPKDKSWLRVTTNTLEKENVAAGGFYKRQFGLFTIDIFEPKGSGNKKALSTFKEIKALYENLNIGNAKCETVSAAFPNNDDNWYNVQADVVFYHEGF